MNMGGTATYLANLMRGLESGEGEHTLVIGSVPAGEIEDPVTSELGVVRIPTLSREFSIPDFVARKSFKKFVAEYRPEIIHSHTFKAGLIARTIKSSAKRIHTFHGHHLYDPEFSKVKVTVLNAIERVLARRTDRLISVGKRVQDELIAVGVGSVAQYRSIAPGIEPIKLLSRESALEEVNRSLSLNSYAQNYGSGESRITNPSRNPVSYLTGSRPIVVWLGRFTQVKRPDRVVEIAKLLPEIDFVMAGGGNLERDLSRAIPENLFMMGWQEKELMWSIADIGLCTSDSEGMPLSLIEAQMAGVPVVATDVGSVAEIVEDRVTGWLTKGDSQEMAKAVEEVAAVTRGSNAMSKASKARAERLFSVDVMAKAHEELYRELLG
ncbi:MAG: glycosyltransferase family 4 protein [Actinomycetota bacterium]